MQSSIHLFIHFSRMAVYYIIFSLLLLLPFTLLTPSDDDWRLEEPEEAPLMVRKNSREAFLFPKKKNACNISIMLLRCIAHSVE